MSLISRETAYAALTDAMRRFAEVHRLGDFGQMASEMEMWGDTSWDPARKYSHDLLLPEQEYEVSEALNRAARFIEQEFVQTQHIAGADIFAAELRHAAGDETYRPDFLASYFET